MHWDLNSYPVGNELGIRKHCFRALLHKLSCNISIYYLVFILPSIKAISPTPLKDMHSQIIMTTTVTLLQLVSNFSLEEKHLSFATQLSYHLSQKYWTCFHRKITSFQNSVGLLIDISFCKFVFLPYLFH